MNINFIEPLLGTQPQKDVAMEYLQSKAKERHPDLNLSDENETLDDFVEKGTTIFHKLDGKPIYYDYHVKGFLKESGNIQNPLRGVKNLRSKIDNFVFVEPRRIELILPEGGKVDYIERPLRAMTMQGPRVSLARSEMLPAGTKFSCKIVSLGTVITEEILRDLLDYGQFKGFGQWRNGSYGRFTYELKKDDVVE